MATTIKANKSGTLKIIIKKSELQKWVPEDAPQGLVQHWIATGRERETLREHIDSELANHERVTLDELRDLKNELQTVKDTLNRYVEVFNQVAHLLTVSSSLAQYELETIKFKKKHSSLSQEESNKFNLSEIKDKSFRKLLSDLFPEMDHDFLLTEFKPNGAKDA